MTGSTLLHKISNIIKGKDSEPPSRPLWAQERRGVRCLFYGLLYSVPAFQHLPHQLDELRPIAPGFGLVDPLNGGELLQAEGLFPADFPQGRVAQHLKGGDVLPARQPLAQAEQGRQQLLPEGVPLLPGRREAGGPGRTVGKGGTGRALCPTGSGRTWKYIPPVSTSRRDVIHRSLKSTVGAMWNSA